MDDIITITITITITVTISALGGVLSGARRQRQGAITAIVSHFIIGLPLSCICAFTFNMGIYGLVIGRLFGKVSISLSHSLLLSISISLSISLSLSPSQYICIYRQHTCSSILSSSSAPTGSQRHNGQLLCSALLLHSTPLTMRNTQ